VSKSCVLDIETDDLLEKCTTLHCLVLRDPDTEELIGSYTDQPGYPSIAEGLKELDKYDVVYGHNIIRFDRPALDKLTGHKIPWSKVRDTQIVAFLRWPGQGKMAYLNDIDRPLLAKGLLPPHCFGKHSLEAWGYRLGCLKGDYKSTNDFSKWSPEMQTYCEQDTLVTAKLIKHIRKSGGAPWLAIETELELARYLHRQELNGWPFDEEKATELLAVLSARREDLHSKLVDIFGSWEQVDKVFTPKRDNKKLGYKAGVEVTKYKTVVFNPGSRQQVAKRLKELYGWEPKEFTDNGQPKVDEATLKSLPDVPGKMELIEYFTVSKRLGQLAEGKNAWLKLMEPHPDTGMKHIHHGCIQAGTVTHRATHIRPNIAQVPAVGKEWGKECRELFCVPEGWVQVGADASGLELRMLAHYMAAWDGGAYSKTVTEGKNEDGTDVHSQNRNALGLEGKEGRDRAKVFIYAFLYGAGDLKLGLGVPPTAADIESYRANKKAWEGSKRWLLKKGEPADDKHIAAMIHGGVLRERFQNNLPALASLIESVKAKAKRQGYLTLIDGRRVPVRYQHAALNCLLQGSGSVVCKRWIVRTSRRLEEEFGPQGWDGKWAALGWIHDELQIAVRPEIADRVCQILVEEIREVGLEFNLRCPLDGEAKVGRNWAETH